MRRRGVNGSQYKADWLNRKRADLISYIYGTVDFTAVYPSAIERNFAITPTATHATTVDRYTLNDLGGRGGTAYGWLIKPATITTDMLAIAWAGHGCFWNEDPIVGVVDYSLERGCPVLAVELPLCGNNGISTIITINGVPTLIEANGGMYHGFQPLDADGGPNATRMFLDIGTVSLNQAILDIAPSFIFCAGHSGGGVSAELFAAIDTRIHASYSIFGSSWWPWPTYRWPSGPNDWDTCESNKVYQVAPNAVRNALGAFPGRRNMKIVGDLDSVFPTLDKHDSVDD
jgi:hypothetical protein